MAISPVTGVFKLGRPVLFVQGVIGFCLAIQPTEGDMGTIGRKLFS